MMILVYVVINIPKRGIGPSSVDKIQAYAVQNDLSMFDALAEVDFIVYQKSNTRMYYFYDMMQNIIKQQEFLEITEIVNEVLEKSGYREMLERKR